MTHTFGTTLAVALALAGLTVATTGAGLAQQAPPQTQTAASTPSWQRFTSRDYGFSALMPGSPTQNNTASASGRSTLHRFYVAPSGGDTMYLVQVSQPPPDRMHAGIPADIADRYARGSGTQVVSQRTTTFAGQQGREATFHDAKTNMEHHVIWVLANGHAYLIAVAGSRQFVDGANAKRFLASFRLNS